MKQLAPRVLVIGSATCSTSPWILAELEKRGADYFSLDFLDFDRFGVSFHFLSDAEKDRVITTYFARDLELSTERLVSAYFREVAPKYTLKQLEPNRLHTLDAPGADQLHSQHVLAFCSAFLEYLNRRAFCLLPVSATSFASNKMVQLAQARSLGFRVPETYIGSDLDEIRAFARRVGQVIAKPYVSQSAYFQGNLYKTYTSLVTPDDLDALSASPYPICLQEAFVDKLDVRVGQVGRTTMATEIHIQASAEDEHILDFRHYESAAMHDRERARFAKHDLPESVAERCREYLRRMKLQYAMMDLLRLPDGDYVFLEANTKGMFGEVGYGGHDVIAAIVDLLMDPDTHRLR